MRKSSLSTLQVLIGTSIGNSIRKLVLAGLKLPIRRQRENLFHLFLQKHSVSKEVICLDVGGTSGGFERLGELCRAVAVNIEIPDRMAGWDIVLADGRCMPFADKSIDIVICNALLEHVNTNRKDLVAEIRRISKRGYFVSVPYYYSPLEPHYLIPFFQFVPEKVRVFLLFRLGLTLGWMNRDNYHEIRLFTRRGLMKLFPEAQISTLRCYGIPVNLVAFAYK
jgi:SAM-dependent methyltransferase